jgi:hypothetical protein
MTGAHYSGTGGSEFWERIRKLEAHLTDRRYELLFRDAADLSELEIKVLNRLADFEKKVQGGKEVRYH